MGTFPCRRGAVEQPTATVLNLGSTHLDRKTKFNSKSFTAIVFRSGQTHNPETIAVRMKLVFLRTHSPSVFGYVTFAGANGLLLLPSPTKCRIELHERECLILLRGDKVQLRGEKVRVRGEYFQVAG